MRCNITRLVCGMLSLVVALFLAACGGGGGGSTASSGSGVPAPSGSGYTVGGTVAGLSGTVVLQNNHGDNLTVTGNGAFSFASPAASGSAYSVTVLVQPTGQSCSVAHGAGSISGTAVTNVAVNCASSTAPTVSVTVSPTGALVAPNGTQAFTATVSGTTNTAVTWSVTENGGGSVDSTGHYTAPASTGTFHVVATSVTDSTRSASAAATVRALSSSFVPQLIGNQILDIKGNRIVGRGPEMVSASSSDVGEIDKIAGWGANGLRLLLTLDAANGMTPAAFDSIVGEAVKKHMLVWISLYMWDSSANYAVSTSLGGGNFYSLTAPAGTGTCSKTTPAPCYLAMWQRQWLKDLVAKYSSNIIIDGMQEFVGTVSDASTEAARQEWAAAAKINIAFFRAEGYKQPIEIMSNFQGRDLYAIHEYGDAIRKTDTVTVQGYPQTMFGWQAYWGTTDGWYPSYQGALFYPGQNKTLSGPDAIHLFATQENFPIEIGIDNYGGDTNLDYTAEIDQCATDNGTWLWWSYRNGDVECPASGATCQAYVKAAPNGFGGASPLTAP
jgi:hypothetical protein